MTQSHGKAMIITLHIPCRKPPAVIDFGHGPFPQRMKYNELTTFSGKVKKTDLFSPFYPKTAVGSMKTNSGRWSSLSFRLIVEWLKRSRTDRPELPLVSLRPTSTSQQPIRATLREMT